MSYWVAGATVVGSIGSALINKSAANKNASATSNLQYQPIDLTKLQSDAQAAARDNAAKSIALEKDLMPSLSAARFGLQDQVAEDLAGGGKLPTDVYNQVARESITGANSAGLYGGGGPITAAQLGLTALQLRNQNQNKAAALTAQNPLPVAGLDPGQLASATIADKNASNYFTLAKSGALSNANQASANASGGLLGSLGGIASLFSKSGGGGGGGGGATTSDYF